MFLAAIVLVGCGARSITDFDPGDDAFQDGGAGAAGLQGHGDSPGDLQPNACGNGVIDLGEACDRGDLGGENCTSVTLGAMNAGTLRCSANCGFETNECYSAQPPATGGYGQGGYAGSGGVYPPPGGMGGYYGPGPGAGGYYGPGPGAGGYYGPGPATGGYYGMGGTFGRPPIPR